MSSRTSRKPIVTGFRVLAGAPSCSLPSRTRFPRRLSLLSTSQPTAAWLPPTRTCSTPVRLAHSMPRPPPPPASEARMANTPKQPSYELTFTCIPCGRRSAHSVSKQGYHHGSVLITCPSCRNRHLISDHLRIFGNQSLTVEDLMRDRGRLVKRGTLGEDGTIELWEDGSSTIRADRQADAEGCDPKPAARTSGRGAGEDDAPPGSTFGRT